MWIGISAVPMFFLSHAAHNLLESRRNTFNIPNTSDSVNSANLLDRKFYRADQGIECLQGFTRSWNNLSPATRILTLYLLSIAPYVIFWSSAIAYLKSGSALFVFLVSIVIEGSLALIFYQKKQTTNTHLVATFVLLIRFVLVLSGNDLWVISSLVLLSISSLVNFSWLLADISPGPTDPTSFVDKAATLVESKIQESFAAVPSTPIDSTSITLTSIKLGAENEDTSPWYCRTCVHTFICQQVGSALVLIFGSSNISGLPVSNISGKSQVALAGLVWLLTLFVCLFLVSVSR